jgi:hypothetical protein
MTTTFGCRVVCCPSLFLYIINRGDLSFLCYNGFFSTTAHITKPTAHKIYASYISFTVFIFQFAVIIKVNVELNIK